MDKVMELYVRSMVAISQPRKGQGLVEYALILVLVSLVVLVALAAVGTQLNTVYGAVKNAI